MCLHQDSNSSSAHAGATVTSMGYGADVTDDVIL